MILAFALAVNEGNIAAGDLESAATDLERKDARKSMDTANGYCFHIRDLILKHCKQHGC